MIFEAEPFRLIVSGGGTGGHTFPALTTVRALRARTGGRLEVLWVGAAGSLEERVATAEGIPFASVATGKVRRARNVLGMLSAENVRDMFRVPLGVYQACSIVRRFRPDVVLGTGGYVAVPVGVAARVCRVPLVIHEQTVRLGLANRVLARGAARVAVTAEASLELLSGAARKRAVVTGNPVRAEVLTGRADRAPVDGFDRALPTVYVTGGAQGARQINGLVTAILPWLLERANVVHQCGPAEEEQVAAAARTLPPALAARYQVKGFVGAELPDVLALADVVVSRSGAGTIAEVTALGKAAVLIPLASSAGNEQAHNASYLERAGAAVALLGEVTPEKLQAAVAPLLADPARRAALAAQARRHGRPDAAERLADEVLHAG
ncbi:undecaprenyldiphospho-muramoylpentapeptide beta-N-acetylglucosaminyltransferase [Herbidospora galbida]|uniref:UDP-N-acetylglucosamine--N-acetylmuramyl-(pentapeptide) pyrophosphoryl-undecaprenol N-acetylglucosamine transferase n=1 Tax=Herbidospora galbida TaxID=2575442 RepID=A0A4U3MEX6_9ACTN|nr:undecaprenyldiphospho-muramoylpentapeptide beta-N-acetylglucosaminyltransferase [Herbidospora galbida]TKK86286.1 undecaprenyldiphospho-muramoylpentapeptide beta-N-acetylglucosaminyltransferase [Herbidospora galbida]